MQKWPHSPEHRFNEKGTYMVTGATYQKTLLFKSDNELNLLQNLCLELAEHYQWHLEAWAFFPNHYHFIAHSNNPLSLKKFITHFHSNSAKQLNVMQGMPGRKVWFQFWDTLLTYHNSYLSRLHYVMENPVRHKIVEQATLYKWCSASWFAETANKSYYQIVKSFKIDKIGIQDEFL